MVGSSKNYPLPCSAVSAGWFSSGGEMPSCCKCAYCPEHLCCQFHPSNCCNWISDRHPMVYAEWCHTTYSKHYLGLCLWHLWFKCDSWSVSWLRFMWEDLAPSSMDINPSVPALVSGTDLCSTVYMGYLNLLHHWRVNPCDFFLWGFMKQKLFLKDLATLLGLRAIVSNCEITEDMCCCMATNIRSSFGSCVTEMEHALC
jgi:hypothetical protein